MTNAEKYKYELRHILDMGHEIAVVDGEPTPCGWVDNCHKCAFVSEANCMRLTVDWMLEECE